MADTATAANAATSVQARASTSRPVVSGSIQSSMYRSKLSRRTLRRKSAPFPNALTECSWFWSHRLMIAT